MNIRKATKSDVESIVELCEQHAKFEEAAFEKNDQVHRLTQLLFASDFKLNCLVVEDKKEIIGYATFFKQFSTWNASFYLYLDCLFIQESARSKGIGTQLMEHIQAYARNNNCKEVQWQTPSFNVRAIEFYTKLKATSKNKQRFTMETK